MVSVTACEKLLERESRKY